MDDVQQEKIVDTTKTNVTRWPYLLVGAITMLFAGIIYAWSILKAPMQSEFGWSASALALNFTLTLCFFCIGGVLGSILTKKLSIRKALIFAAALVLIGFGLVSFLTANTLFLLYFAYGGLCGLGIGIAYNVVVSSTGAWFPDQKGTSSGVLMMCFGLSSLLLGKAANYLFMMESIGWRKTYIILGVLIGGVLAISSFFVRAPGPDVVLPKPKKKQGVSEDFELKDYSTGEMIRRRSFQMFFIYIILTSAIGNTVISFARDLALSVGAEAALATTLVGVLSVFNGLGRILCGLLFDFVGRRKTMLIANVLAILAPVILLIAVTGNSLALGIVGLCVTGISFGCCPTITTAFTAAFYGSQYFPTNYSVANLMLIPSSFTATIANSLLESSGSFVTPFIMLLVFSGVALIINFNLRRP